MFAKMRTGTKILSAFALVLGLVAVLAALSHANVGRLGAIIESYGQRELPGTNALWKIRQAEAGVRANGGVLANPMLHGEVRREAHRRLAGALERVATGEKEYKALPHAKKTAALWKEYEPLAERWRRDLAAFRQALQEREQAAAEPEARRAELDRKLAQAYSDLFTSAVPVAEGLQKLIVQTAEDAHALSVEADEAEHSALVTLLSAVGLIALILLATGLVLARSVARVIRGLLTEARKLEEGVQAGRLDVRGDLAAVSREFQPVIQGVNRTMDAFVRPIRLTADYVDRISKGDLPPKIEERYEGDFNLIKQNLNVCIDAIRALVADADGLAQAAIAGRLSSRADATRHQGDFRKIVEDVNGALDAVMKPIDEASHVLERLAQRDLRARVKGSYQGDHAKIAAALNVAADSLHDALAQVAQAVSQVSAASGQIASSSQAVASGASEQASSLEETGSSLESMSSMTKQAADNAQQASALAGDAKGSAIDGSAAMEQMTAAMGRIKVSAESTSQIIKDINEIAFQTNLLALNAAVEAARAGAAGRGFAVVAEEVRSLALRSKEAANKTEALIRQSVKEAGEGEVTAARVNEKLAEIVAAVSKVTDIVTEIDATSREQSAGIDQVNKAMGQINTVTQQNAASSEESSSAAAQLSAQSEELAAMVGTFQLDGLAPTLKPGAAVRRPVAPARKPTAGKNGRAGIALRPEEVTPLDW
jgi:methyl-accepting chemotaxis protein